MDDEDPVVSREDACPVCGERRIDYLIWIDDRMVRCQMCHTEYPLPAK